MELRVGERTAVLPGWQNVGVLYAITTYKNPDIVPKKPNANTRLAPRKSRRSVIGAKMLICVIIGMKCTALLASDGKDYQGNSLRSNVSVEKRGEGSRKSAALGEMRRGIESQKRPRVIRSAVDSLVHEWVHVWINGAFKARSTDAVIPGSAIVYAICPGWHGTILLFTG